MAKRRWQVPAEGPGWPGQDVSGAESGARALVMFALRLPLQLA